MIGGDVSGRPWETGLIASDADDEAIVVPAMLPETGTWRWSIMLRVPDPIDRADDEAVADWLASNDVAFDPADLHDGEPLRRIVAADEAVGRARVHLVDEVRAAHDAGLSWTAIGAVLGISRQAARQRFA